MIEGFSEERLQPRMFREVASSSRLKPLHKRVSAFCRHSHETIDAINELCNTDSDDDLAGQQWVERKH